jgi:hypothetical protein
LASSTRAFAAFRRVWSGSTALAGVYAAHDAGAIGQQGSRVLVISGHDTNLSNMSGLLQLSWRLPGYQPDDTPPGGALVFSLSDSLTNGRKA